MRNLEITKFPLPIFLTLLELPAQAHLIKRSKLRILRMILQFLTFPKVLMLRLISENAEHLENSTMFSSLEVF